MSKVENGITKTIDEADALVYGALATAREGEEDPDGKHGSSQERFRVIADLLERYRAIVSEAVYGKAA